MRTPLSSIMGVTQMTLETAPSDTQKEFAETVAESAQALVTMVDTIADFSSCLGSPAAILHNLTLKLQGNGAAHASNGNAASAVAQSGSASLQGIEEVPVKSPNGRGRTPFSAAGANFTTRVPADTAKLIRILVAEDHLMNQRVMLRMLARLGYTADAVCNGVEAVSALTRSPYDIVLMDCQMPELDGYEATRMIRKSGGRFQSTPIIAVTANAMAGDREKCLASGMSDYMSKPVLAQTLATTLEKWILPDAAAGSPLPANSPPAAASPGASVPLTRMQMEPEPQPAAAEAPKDAALDIGPAVDAGALDNLRSMDAGDEGFMAKIIELFLADLTERIESLKVAAATCDGNALGRLAHALKGSCGHFGASRLAGLCRKVEQIGAEQPVGDASGILRELTAEADRVRIALEEARDLAPANSANSPNSMIAEGND